MDLEKKCSRIENLRDQIAECKRCSLSETRTNTVPGEGNVDANILFIGEAPGKNEDLQGKPFIGRAGDIFDKLLTSADLTRDDIYLCNILKCRPPQNRNPLSSEIRACVGSLDLQIKIVNPVVIATLGNFATTYIFDKFSIEKKSISSVAGKVFEVDTDFGKKKIIPLFHPAVATYNINKLDDLIADFQIVRKTAGDDVVKVDAKSSGTETLLDEGEVLTQMEMWPQ